jgi:hypothetical protein
MHINSITLGYTSALISLITMLLYPALFILIFKTTAFYAGPMSELIVMKIRAVIFPSIFPWAMIVYA